MLLTLRSQYSTTSPRAAADAVITALTPAAWYRNATDVVSSGGFASIWADYASSDKGLVLPGVNGNTASTPDSAAVSITGDIDLIAKVRLNDWTPAANSFLIGKDSGSGNRAYAFYVTATTGTLAFFFLNGATNANTQSSVATGVTDGATKWVRVTRASASGNCNFYTSDDGSTWSQLGTADRAGAASALADTAIALTVGGDSNNQNTINGSVYRAIVKDGIDGTTVFDADFSAQAIGTGSFTESSSNAATVTINTSGASPAHIGKARDLLQGTGTNQPAYSAGAFTFDGVDNYMTASFTSNQPITYYLVGSQVTWSAGFEYLFDGGIADRVALAQAVGTPGLSLYAGSFVANNTNLAVNTAGIVCAVFNGASSSLRVNNTVKTTGNAGANNAAGVTLGGRAGGSGQAGHMTAREFIIFSAAHDDATQSSVITALNNALTVF